MVIIAKENTDMHDTRLDTGPRSAGVTLKNVSKAYGEHAVVREVSLAVEAGEFVSLLGPSGSGKTTCLNMIAGFTPVTSGEVLIGGRSVTALPPHRRNLGVVFQNYALFPHLTVFENVAYPLKRRRIDSGRRRRLVAEFLQLVHLGEHSEKYPAELSGGQQQRVALARALVYEPNVLLMDEPLGALDKKLREWLQIEIKRIHEEVGATFLFVTHDQEEALSMSDKIAVFNDGRIEQFGTGQELYHSPRTLFVGQFLGESTVFRGEVEANGGGRLTLSVNGYPVHALVASAVPSEPVIFVRPEATTLTALGQGGTGGNAVPVKVATVSYLGAHWRFQIELPDGSHGSVRSATRPDGVNAGAAADLTWPIEAGSVLPDTTRTL